MVLLGVVIVADLFSLWQGNHSHQLIGRLIADADSVTAQEIDRADALYRIAAIAQVVFTVATAVVFIVWFHRTRVNAEVFAPEYREKKRGWAIWGWIVPIANLWFPRQIAADIWNASADERSRSKALLNWWWALWIVNLVFGRLATLRYEKVESPEEIKGAFAGLMASDLFNIAAAVLAIFFVRRLTRMQHEKALRGQAA